MKSDKMCFCGHEFEFHDQLSKECLADLIGNDGSRYVCSCSGFEWVENKKEDGE